MEESSETTGTWESFRDTKGNVYYVNSVTQETAWNIPEASKAIVERPENGAHNDDGDGKNKLSGGWYAYVDAQGQEYYYNETTEETSWEIPIELRRYEKASCAEAGEKIDKIRKADNGDVIGDEKKILSDIWLSREELRAKAKDYVLTMSDRMALEKDQRAKKRAEIREHIRQEKERISKEIYDMWEPSIIQAKMTGSLNCSWKGFRVVHPAVYELKDITALRLVGNALNDVPRNIGFRLRNLQVLSLSCNGMTAVPKSFGLLTNLTDLNLQKNRLRSLPEELCNLTRLTHLDVTNNLLNALPEGFSRLQNIVRLSFERNCLAFLPTTFGKVRLEKLVLNSNSLYQFPSPIYRIDCLKQLSLNQNSLESLPEAICELERLEFLSACNNSLTDLPEGITKLKSLKRLWLDWNGIEELPEGFRFLENLKDLKMEGNPMRFPMIEIVQRGGATAVLKWCRNRHKRDVRMSKRAVIEALQKTFRLITKYDIADKSMFEPNTPHDNGLGVVEQYYAFQIDTLYDIWLPAIDALDPARREFRKATWFYPYTREQLVIAMREYIDSSGTSAGIFNKVVLFRKCSCVDEYGERSVCIPPKPGYLCKRTAVLVKMVLATGHSDQQRRIDLREKVKIKQIMEKTRREAQAHIESPEVQEKLEEKSRDLADGTMEDRLRADFLKKKTKSLREKYDRHRVKVEGRKVKLIRKRKERIESLKAEKSDLLERIKTANEFEIEVMEEDIEKINAMIKNPPEDESLKDLDASMKTAEREYREAARNVAGTYKPRGKLRKKLDRVRRVYKELVYDIKCRLMEEHVANKVNEVEKTTKHQFKCMRTILARWSKLTEAATFSKWATWTKRRIATRARLRQLQAERAKLRKESSAATEAMKEAEYAKWEKCTDPYTGGEYYRHRETGEEVFDIPIREWSDHPQKMGVSRTLASESKAK
eukprot:g3793.t1